MNFVLFDNSKLGGHVYNTYVANGSLINNVLFFLFVDNLTFHISPRRILTIESNTFNNLDTTNVITFKNTTHVINDDGHDDTSTTNDIETVFGTVPSAVTSESFTSGVSQTIFTVTKNPYNTLVTDNGTVLQMDTSGSPAASTYVVDFYNKTITFSTGRTSGHTIVIQYSYESPTAGQAVYFRTSDGTSITQNGRHFKRITLQGVYPSDLTQVNNFSTNFITKYKNVNQRITINAPTLINTLRENIAVNVIDNVKKINTTAYSVLDINGNTLSGNSTPLIVTSMTWYYPDGKTDIHVGSYMYDAYDLDNVSTDQIQQQQNAFIRNKTT